MRTSKVCSRWQQRKVGTRTLWSKTPVGNTYPL